MKLKISPLSALSELVSQGRLKYWQYPTQPTIVKLSYQEMVDICQEAYLIGTKYHDSQILNEFVIKKEGVKIAGDKLLLALDDALRHGFSPYTILYQDYELELLV